MKIKKIDNFNINKDNEVTLTIAGNTAKIRAMSQKTLPHIQKLSKEEYMVLATGEVKDIDHSNTKRIDNTASIKQSFSRLRDLINANVTKPSHCKFVTLTYKENMTDNEQLKTDLKSFYKRWNYYCKQNGIIPPAYITVIETQGRGALHAHCIQIYKSKAPFVPNEVLFEKWKKGFVHVTNICGDISDIGNYLCCYLTDISIDELKDVRQLKNVKENDIKIVEVTDDNGKKVSKAILKGGRLKNYKKGMHIFRHSRNIKKPVRYNCRYGEALEQVKDHELVYEKSIALIDEDGTEKTKINYQHYNKAVSKSKKG